jgi:hypothetical protein
MTFRPLRSAALAGVGAVLFGASACPDPRNAGDDDDAARDDDDAVDDDDDDDAGGTCLQGDRVYRGELAFGPLSTPAHFEDFCADYDAVDGNLGISGLSLTTLEGLECLCGISGFVWLYENQALVTLSGLEGIEYIGGSLRLERNFALANISNIAGLKDIGGEFRLEENHSLVSLTGLNNLESVGDSVVIRNNNQLADTSGLGSVTLIGGDFILDGNELITNFAGPSRLETLGGILEITNNAALNAMAGFNELLEIASNVPVGSTGYEVRIAGNPLLASVQGFPRIQALPVGLYLDGSPTMAYSAFAGVSVVQGKLELRGFGAGSDLSGLTGIASVVSDVIFSNFNGTSIPMNSLITVGGSLRVQDSHQIADVNGFSALRSVGGDLVIDNNDGLGSLLGLFGVTTVGGNFQITNNAQIANGQAEGLRDQIGEQNIGGSITISN